MKPDRKPPPAYLYAHTAGGDIEDQIKLCTHYAGFLEMEIVQVFADAPQHRKEREACIEATIAAKGAFLTYSLPAAFANRVDLYRTAERLHSAGCCLISASEPLDTYTNPEAFEALSAITSLDDAISRGRPKGSVRFGWKMARDSMGVEEKIKDAQEQATIRRMCKLYDSGLTYRAIARQLETEGMLCRGRPWADATMVGIIRRYFGSRWEAKRRPAGFQPGEGHWRHRATQKPAADECSAPTSAKADPPIESESSQGEPQDTSH